MDDSNRLHLIIINNRLLFVVFERLLLYLFHDSLPERHQTRQIILRDALIVHFPGHGQMESDSLPGFQFSILNRSIKYCACDRLFI